MKTLYLLRGLPGSGKSTFADTLLKNLPFIQKYEADMFFYDDNGNYNFDVSKLHQAHQWCENKVNITMEVGCDIIVSNTLTTEKELKPYYELAKFHGYQVVSLILENRHGGKSIHDVPDETLDKMEKRFSLKLK